MYSLTIGNFGAQTFKVSNLAGLSDLMDKFLVSKRDGVPATLSNIHTRKVLRTFTPAPVVEEKAALEPIKLSDAMRAALDSDDSGITGLAGKANTLRALESRGLVKIQGDGVARLTDLGRQYRRV